MRIAVVIGLVVAALAAAAWLLLAPERGAEDVGTALPERATGAPGKTGPTLTGGAGGRRDLGGASMARARIQGRVTRAGQPARAEVEARWRPARPDDRVPAYAFGEWAERAVGLLAAAAREPGVRTRSADDGTYALDGVRVGVVEVVARGEDGARARACVTLPAEGACLTLDLRLEAPGLSLRGQVLHPDRRPVSGSAALLPATGEPPRGTWNVEAAFPLASLALADDGGFAFDGLDAGLVAVHVRLEDGTQALSLPVRLPRAEPLLVVVPAMGAPVRGTVLAVPGDAPVAGAHVLLALPPNGIQAAWTASVTTDAEGRFERPVPATGVSVRVGAAGFADEERWLDVAEREVRIHLLRVARVEGRVLAKGDRRPVAGAWVRIGEEQALEPAAISDGEGRYVLERVRPGPRVVFVHGGGWTSPGLGADDDERSTAALTLLVPAGARLTHDLEAEPAQRPAGRVLDADGRPVAGAVVRITTFESGDESLLLENWTDVLSSPASDADGRFALADLPDGVAVHLEVTAPGFPRVSSGPHRTGAGRPPLEIRLPRPRYADVEVVLLDDGTPIAGAVVTCRVSVGPGDETETYGSWITDARGQVRAGPLPEGRTVVRVATEGRRRASADATEGRGPSGATLTARVLVPRGQTIRGRVLRPDGTPALGASVRAEQQGRSFGTAVPSGIDGEFLLHLALTGSFALVAHAAGYRDSERREAESGAEGVVLTLGPPATDERRRMVVRVLDPDGRPVPGFHADLRYGSASWGTDGVDGSAEIVVEDGPDGTLTQGLARGDLYLHVHDAHGADRLPLPLAPATRRISEADLGGVEVRLTSAPGLEGRVLAPDGAPVRGVKVWATADAGAGEPAAARSPAGPEATTDPEGRFRLLGAAEGENRVSVRPPRGFTGPREPARGAPGGPPVEIRLRRAVTAHVRVLGPDGSALPGAEVQAAHGEDDVWGDADVDGVATFVDLDPEARWKLVVDPADPQQRLQTVTIDPWVPGDTEVRLPRGLALAGRVVDAQGRPVASARVWAVGAKDEWLRSEDSAADGTFRLEGLPAGPLTLRAAPPGALDDEHFQSAPLACEGGREGLTLTVDAGTDVALRLAGWSRPKVHVVPFLLHLSEGAWVSLGAGAELRDEGRFAFRALRTGERYAVWVWGGEGRYAYAELAVRPGEQTVAWQEGRSIEGRVSGVPPGEHPHVRAADDLGRFADAAVQADGRYALAGLPPGTWRLRVTADGDDGAPLEATATAATGTTADLALRPAAR